MIATVKIKRIPIFQILYMPINQNIKLTVDAVIFSKHEKSTYVLLVKRKNAPFKGQWVLPGGFVDEHEDLEQAAKRELEEETSLKTQILTQLKAYGTPGRDPRGHTVTVAFWGIVDKASAKIKAADDADKAKWWDIELLPKLGFDHADILHEALKASHL